MQSPFNYIIEVDNRYNNKVDVDGVELVVNTEITERDAIFTNRIGRVVNTPLYTFSGSNNINVGDEVIIHHNVFRRMVAHSGKEVNSGSYLGENQAIVFHDQIFAYKREGKWQACEGYCFVKPRENEETWINGNVALLSGHVWLYDDRLKQQGVKEGSLVGFTPNSEYEFYIDNTLYYRILSNHIYGLKENATEEA